MANEDFYSAKYCCACVVELGGHLPPALLPQTSVNEVDRCVRESTGWSECSTSCGVGVSVRVSNDNDECVAMHERRLCVVRPCGVDDSDLVCHGQLEPFNRVVQN